MTKYLICRIEHGTQRWFGSGAWIYTPEYAHKFGYQEAETLANKLSAGDAHSIYETVRCDDRGLPERA